MTVYSPCWISDYRQHKLIVKTFHSRLHLCFLIIITVNATDLVTFTQPGCMETPIITIKKNRLWTALKFYVPYIAGVIKDQSLWIHFPVFGFCTEFIFETNWTFVTSLKKFPHGIPEISPDGQPGCRRHGGIMNYTHSPIYKGHWHSEHPSSM